MVTSILENGGGRLANHIFRNVAVSMIAEKHDLKVEYSYKSSFHRIGIPLYSGIKNHEHTLVLDDENYFKIYNCICLLDNLDANTAFFQTKVISNLIYDYLNTDRIKNSIIKKNLFHYRYDNNNDLYVHIRLTDVEQYNPGINYYIDMIKKIKFDKLFLSTDDTNHAIIKAIMELYPDCMLILHDEVITIQFASTCKHILLSHGSFSAIIGYLSFFSTVYYPTYKHNGVIDKQNGIWYGDMFSIKNWINCPL